MRIHLGSVGCAVALAIGGAAAFAQEYTTRMIQAPMSQAHQAAHQSNDPAACFKAVAKAREDVWMRIQHTLGMENRGTIDANLDAAEDALARGDNEDCWHFYDRSQAIVR